MKAVKMDIEGRRIEVEVEMRGAHDWASPESRQRLHIHLGEEELAASGHLRICNADYRRFKEGSVRPWHLCATPVCLLDSSDLRPSREPPIATTVRPAPRAAKLGLTWRDNAAHRADLCCLFSV